MRSKYVLKIATDFTHQTLGDLDPKHMCFSVSFPLTSYLWFHNIPNEIIHGPVRGVSHFVLHIKDGSDFIFDATMRQFDPTKPAIYFGPIAPDYSNFSYFNFMEAYQIWEGYLYRGGQHIPWPKEIPDDRDPFDINKQIQFHQKAYSLVQKEALSRSFYSHHHYQMTCMYLSAIEEASRINKSLVLKSEE